MELQFIVTIDYGPVEDEDTFVTPNASDVAQWCRDGHVRDIDADLRPDIEAERA